MMTIEGLKVGLTLYGSWGALSRAGFQNEILREYANQRIELTDNDIQELRRIFLCPYFEDRWQELLAQYKEKHEQVNSVNDQDNNNNNYVVLPAVHIVPSDLECENGSGGIV